MPDSKPIVPNGTKALVEAYHQEALRGFERIEKDIGYNRERSYWNKQQIGILKSKVTMIAIFVSVIVNLASLFLQLWAAVK